MQNYHITKNNGLWNLKPQGEPVLKTFKTKIEAVSCSSSHNYRREVAA